MSGLLAKDMELLKINMKTYLAVFLIGFMYLIVQKNGSTFFVSYSIFVSIGVSVGTISYDAYHHGMNYLMTLPVTRKQYVWSKYLLGFCFAAVTGVAALLIGILKVQVTGNAGPSDQRRCLNDPCRDDSLRNDSTAVKVRSGEKQNHHGSGSSGTFFAGGGMQGRVQYI